MNIRRVLVFLATISSSVLGCSHQSQLDHAVTAGDVTKMQAICDGVPLPIILTPPRPEVRARACKAREAHDRSRLAAMTCDQLAKDRAFWSPNNPLETRALYTNRLAACEDWAQLYRIEQSDMRPVLLREARTTKGEAGLRAEVLTGWTTHLIVENMQDSGPVIADEVAAVFDTTDPRERKVLFEYLARHKHPKAKALVAEYLASSDQRLRRSGCWGASELGDADFREHLQRLAMNDSFSVVELGRGGAISQTYVVRDECRQALAKLPGGGAGR